MPRYFLQIPEGDWFCSQCRPVEPRRSYRRRKREESDEEDDERQDMKLLEIDGEEESDEESEDKSEEEEDDDDDSDGKWFFFIKPYHLNVRLRVCSNGCNIVGPTSSNTFQTVL